MTTAYHANERQTPPKRVFFAATVMLFFCAFSAADSVGFVPCQMDGTCASAPGVSLEALPMLGEESPVQAQAAGDAALAAGAQDVPAALPERIRIGAIGLDLPVQNPATTDVAALDALLTNGPARYARSAKPGEEGNVIIFAHSSHLPIVHNKMYQAFNRIPELQPGDLIVLDGGGREYLYSVVSIRKADVESGTAISLSADEGARLTLVTCDTLTGKSSRFILDAEFIGVSAI